MEGFCQSPLALVLLKVALCSTGLRLLPEHYFWLSQSGSLEAISKVDRSRREGLAFGCISALLLGKWLCITTFSGSVVSLFIGYSWCEKKENEMDPFDVLVRQYFVVCYVCGGRGSASHALMLTRCQEFPKLWNQTISRCCQTGWQAYGHCIRILQRNRVNSICMYISIYLSISVSIYLSTYLYL